MTRRRWQQTRLSHFSPPPQHHKTNIPPSGNPLQEQQDNDGYMRYGFQNICGSSIDSGLEIATEIDTRFNSGTGIQGLSETNRPWTHTNKWRYDFMMEAVFQQARTGYTSSPTDRTNTYQPGGNLLSITRDNMGQINSTGKDLMGRFAWTTIRGKQDKGILIIVAYRVCQDHNTRIGAFTAYQQQYMALRAQGHKQPNPRQQILIDQAELMTTKQQEGYRPIIMMDANGDTHHPTTPDIELHKLIESTNLADIFYDKFKESPRTFMWGTKRLDYILIDPSLIPAAESIGYLGTDK
jgi:hypothetical protein